MKTSEPSNPKLERKTPSHWDVIVVGAGGSGLAAGVSAAESGARVLVLEKEDQPGGTTGIAVGSFTSSGTSLQRAKGLEDRVEDHAVDAGRFAPPAIEARNDAHRREWFLGHSADTFEWLREMGVPFQGPNPEPPNRVPRMHNVIPAAKAYIAILHARLLRLGGELRCGHRVLELLRQGDRVVGVRVSTPAGKSSLGATRGVILAGGDYAASSDLIRRFKGEAFAGIEGINPRATGEGHLLAEAAGAELVNMDITYGPELRFIAPPGRTFEQVLPSSGWLPRLAAHLLPLVPRSLLARYARRLLVTWQHPEDALFRDGAILVNRQGKRFTDETLSPQRELDLARQEDRVGWILLDQALTMKYSAWPHFVSTAPEIAYAYVEDYLRLRPDVAERHMDLATLATSRGLDGEALQRTVEQTPGLKQGPWVLLGPVKAWFTTTEGGARINDQMEVLTSSGQRIPGLYAAGQNGLSGMILWGHGLHIAWALTSGRLAGRCAAQADPG